MFKLIQSPLQKPPNITFLNDGQNPRLTYPRYSSVDQTCSRPNSSMNSSRFDFSKQQKKGLTIQKTDRSQKQRTHSQKKLTLTSAQPNNTCYNSNLSTSQNVNLINARQAYEGFKKNLQLKSSNTTRNAPLQKRSKLLANKYNQQQKFPTSSSSIQIESDPVIQQNENDEEMLGCSINIQKEKNAYFDELNENNNSFTRSSQGYSTPVIKTTPNSPVYQGNARQINFQTQQNNTNNTILQYCQQKISQIKDQTNNILLKNQKKIKELESLLVLNKQKLQAKDKIIRQFQLNLMLKQTSKPHYVQSPISNPGHLRGNSMDYKVNETYMGKSQQFLNSKIVDLEKKIQVISKWSQSQQQCLNQKIDKMNNFMQGFVSVKFHNLKFTLKTFVTKTQQKVNMIMDAISRVQNIVNLNHIDEYERIYLKTKQFTEAIKKLSQIKVVQKVHFDDMKTTMNTVIQNYKHKPSKSNYQNMLQSREVNESFWNNMEDFSQNKNEEYSFTDDSFSYAPGANNNVNFASMNNSSVNEFALGSFPSFSKFSSGNVNKESLQSINLASTEIQINFVKTIEEISKCRQGPVNVYLDKNGSIRYKSSQSYIFDRRGNILKPKPEQIEYCIKMGWVIMS